MRMRRDSFDMPEDQRIEIEEDDDTIGASWDIGVSYDLIGSDDEDDGEDDD